MKGAKVENWTPVRKIGPLFKWKMRGAGSGKWPQRWRTVGYFGDRATNSMDWGHLRRGIHVSSSQKRTISMNMIFLVMHRI